MEMFLRTSFTVQEVGTAGDGAIQLGWSDITERHIRNQVGAQQNSTRQLACPSDSQPAAQFQERLIDELLVEEHRIPFIPCKLARPGIDFRADWPNQIDCVSGKILGASPKVVKSKQVEAGKPAC